MESDRENMAVLVSCGVPGTAVCCLHSVVSLLCGRTLISVIQKFVSLPVCLSVCLSMGYAGITFEQVWSSSSVQLLSMNLLF